MTSGRLSIVFALATLLVIPTAAQPRTSMFVFRNNFWLNLHQFLRGEVYRRREKLTLGIDPASLSDSERARWTAVIDTYIDVAKHDLVFDDWSTKTHNVLSGFGDATVVPDGVLEGTLVAALNAAAPIYRARLWPERRAANDAWIAVTKGVLEGREAVMKAALEHAYHLTWPSGLYLVTSVGEIGPASAVTHRGPAGYVAHILAGAASPRNVAGAPLELLFHEASHTDRVGVRLSAMIDAEATRQKLMAPRDLWHHLIMVTSGELAKRELARTGRPGYRRYDERYEEQIPSVERAAFDGVWLPYLDGKIPFDQALHDLVRDAR